MAQITNNYGLDILGEALLDYQQGKYTEDIKTFSSLDEEDIIPLPHFFRPFHKMPALEKRALKMCKGKILDIGAGAGSHSLYLQEKGHQITALDISAGAIETCSLRGIKRLVHKNILDYSGTKFDTLLLLMNGIGIIEKLANLDRHLKHLKSLLNPMGQIILDSSDIIYMFEHDDEDGGYWIPENSGYYGQVVFVMEYKGSKSDPFGWLYLDYNTLKNAAEANNLNCELVSEGNHYDYLARLTVNS